MMLRNRLSWGIFICLGLIFISFLILPSLLHAKEVFRVERYQGIAKDSRGKIVYNERHEVEYQGTKVVRANTQYLAPSGEQIAELQSSFPKGAFLPSYSFINFSTNSKEGVLCCEGNSLEVYYQEKRKKLEFKANWVTGQGFHYLVQERLDTLDQGELEHFQFLMPLKQGIYPFRLRSAGRDPASPDHERILLEIDQWFFRLFAPKIVATYDRATKRLIRYEGPSNLVDQKGHVEKVFIEYQYSP